MTNTGWTDASQVLYRTALPGIAYRPAAAWQQQLTNRSRFFADYAVSAFSAPVATDVSPALDALAKAHRCIETALGSKTIFRLWDDPLTPGRLEHLAFQRESFRKIRLLAEEAEEHLNRGLISPGISRHWGGRPSHADVQFYLGWESSARNHGRIMDLMDEVSDLRGTCRSAWLVEYTDNLLQSVLGQWARRISILAPPADAPVDLIHSFKDGDTCQTWSNSGRGM